MGHRSQTLIFVSRRHALARLGGAALVLAGYGDARRLGVPATERIIGEPLPMNVHPLGEPLGGLQRAALQALATPWIRVTLGLVTDTTAARAYVGAAPDMLGLVSDFQLRSIDEASWPDVVEATLRRYPQVRRAELLNEPEQFNGLSPTRYVRDFLRPGFERIRERLPSVAVVAAAPIGNRRKGLDYFRRMTDAGADQFCDYRAVHVYFEDERVLSALASATGRSIMVTETGTGVPSQHVHWYTHVIPRIRAMLGAELVFWYVLLESVALAGGPVPSNYVGTSLIAATPDATGRPQAAPGSGLYPRLAGRHSDLALGSAVAPRSPGQAAAGAGNGQG